MELITIGNVFDPLFFMYDPLLFMYIVKKICSFCAEVQSLFEMVSVQGFFFLQGTTIS